MNRSEKAGTLIHIKRNALYCLIFFILVATNICNAGIKPDKDNIVEDVTQLADLYDETIPIGSVAPNFRIKDLNGKMFNSKNVLGKNVTIIYYWSVFCPYCKDSIPHINKIYDKYKDIGLKVLGVNLDGVDFINAIKSFLTVSDIRFTILLDELYKSEFFNAGDPYGVDKTPTIFLINKSGKVIYTAEVDIDYDLIEKLVLENSKNVKKKITILLISICGIIIISLVVYIYFIRPQIIQQKIIDDLKRSAKNEFNK
jgi:peroxiredoxin